MPRVRVDDIFQEMNSVCNKRDKRKLNRVKETIYSLSNEVTLIIIVTDRSWSTFNPVVEATLNLALINHERFHAITMVRPSEWHEFANSLLSDAIGEKWNTVKNAIFDSNVYSDQFITKDASKNWIATTEALARVAAIIHCAPKYRKLVASCQLRSNPAALLELSDIVHKHWLTAESIIGWVDAQFW
jgi:hypothetical protein